MPLFYITAVLNVSKPLSVELWNGPMHPYSTPLPCGNATSIESDFCVNVRSCETAGQDRRVMRVLLATRRRDRAPCNREDIDPFVLLDATGWGLQGQQSRKRSPNLALTNCVPRLCWGYAKVLPWKQQRCNPSNVSWVYLYIYTQRWPIYL